MKSYHTCVLCKKQIIGGDVCINQGKDFAHQICVVNKRIKDTNSSYFDFFECNPFTGGNREKGKTSKKN